MPVLSDNHYGKSRVRLVKVTRDGATHHLHEWNVNVYLTGDFTACFVAGDNTGLLATDTMKNTVYAVARTSTATTPEAFGLELAEFLAGRNPQIASVRIYIEEKNWIRIKATNAEGQVEKHGSAFLQRGPDVHTTDITLPQGGTPTVTSGVKGLVILKTSHSAFAGFKRDELTTLPETHDRLFGTEATISWIYSTFPADYNATRTAIMDTLLSTFAHHDSLSVQQTLYAMAEAVLATQPLVAEMTLTMPNRHNIPIDFSKNQPPFDFEPNNSIFVPQDEPSGHIHARVVR
jgi:urate oxidase